MTSSVVASESGVFVHGQYILSTSLSDPSSNQWAKNLLFSNSSCPPRLKGERYLNWVPRNRSTVQIQSSAVKAYTIYLVPTIPWIKQDNIDQASLRFQDLLSTFLQVLDHFWLIGVLKTCKILSDFIQVLRFAILRFRVPFSNFSFQASANSQRILLYVESRTTNFRVIRIFYVLLRILRIFRFACIFICFSTSFPTIRFDSFPTIWFDSFPTIWFDYFRRLDSIIILFYDLIRFLFRLIPTIRLRELFQSFRKPPRRDQFAIICILYFRHIVRGLPSPHLTWFSTIFGSIQERIIWRSETSFSYLFWVTERSRQLFFSVKISGFPSTLHHQHSLGTSSPCYPTSFPFGVQGCSITPVPPWQHGG